jgi:polycystin 1L2
MEDPVQSTAMNVKKKSILDFILPWWVRYVMYPIIWTIMMVSVLIVVFKGLEYGEDKCKYWLVSFIITIIASILILEPIKVIIVAVVIVTFCRSRIAGIDFENDPYETDNSLNDDEEWMHEIPSSKYKRGNYLSKIGINLDPHEVEVAKRKRIEYVGIMRVLREILIYASFLWFLYIVTYSTSSNSTFSYQTSLKKQFVNPGVNMKKCQENAKYCVKANLEDVDQASAFFYWAKETFAYGLRASRWYNENPQWGLAGFFNDYTSRIIGYGVLRQLRVKKNSCKINSIMDNYIDYCDSSYSTGSEDKSDYHYGWKPHNSSYSPPNGWPYLYKAFQYSNASVLNGKSYSGLFETYSGGGYVYELRGKSSFLEGNLTQLEKLGWIDRQTRAIFAEFTAYNPNINLFLVTTIVIEFLPSGNILANARFDPLDLFKGQNTSMFQMVCAVIYAVYIAWFAVKEIRTLFRDGIREYINFWPIVEWSIVVASVMGYSIYVYRVQQANDLLTFFKETSGNID